MYKVKFSKMVEKSIHHIFKSKSNEKIEEVECI